MDYKKTELSFDQKLYFYMISTLGGLTIGWIFYDSFVIGLFIGVILWSLESEYGKYLNDKRKSELLLQFKDLLYSLASSVSTGRSIRQALFESYEFWQGTYAESDYIMLELKSFITKMERSNIDEIELIEDFASRTGLKDINDMALMCKVCKRTGGNLPKMLLDCSNIIGDKIMLEKELHTIMAQKRFEGYIIAIAPIALMLLMKVASPEYLAPLTHSNTGHLISTMALALIVAAWMIIERVNNIEI